MHIAKCSNCKEYTEHTIAEYDKDTKSWISYCKICGTKHEYKSGR